MHQKFADRVIQIVRGDPCVVGLAAGGSWIGNQMDEFSDIDLVLITAQLVSADFDKMYAYANRFGNLLNAFTGEHVGEKRLLICLYDNPLLHVDIKFVTPDEFRHRVENPVILWDRDGTVQTIIENTVASWPKLDYQWIEDRFWTWVHYTTLKLGRGEYFEALDCLSFFRVNVLSPLLQLKNNQLPRGLRKIEQNFTENDLSTLTETIPVYSTVSIIASLEKSIELYRDLRENLFGDEIVLRSETEQKCMDYFDTVKKRIIHKLSK